MFANEIKYLRNLLKTIENTLVTKRCEELYIELANKQKSGIKYYDISIKKGIEQHTESFRKEVGLVNFPPLFTNSKNVVVLV